MTRADLLQFMRAHRYAVQASVSAAGLPQAALVGIVVTDGFEGERLQWPGLIHLRATATWIRYSDFSVGPPLILEFDADALRRLI